MTVPRTREVVVFEDGTITVTALPAYPGGRSHPWTHGAIVPQGLSAGEFTVLGALAREWCVDLLVQVAPTAPGSPVQVWRLSPTRIRGTAPVRGRFLGTDQLQDAPHAWDVKAEAGYEAGFSFSVDYDRRDTWHVFLSTDDWTDLELCENRAKTPTEYDYFLSYKAKDHEDDDVVARLYARLIADGARRVWYAPENLTAEPYFVEPILRGIERSKRYVVLWTDHSFETQSGADPVPTVGAEMRKRRRSPGQEGGAARGAGGPSQEDLESRHERFAGGRLKMNQFYEVDQLLQVSSKAKPVYLFDLRSDRAPVGSSPKEALGSLPSFQDAQLNELPRSSVEAMCTRLLSDLPRDRW